MSTWHRVQDASRDPQALLDPANWVSATWNRATITCPDCDGTGRFGECERCDGEGEYDEQPRRGVSVCRSLRELAAYMEDSWGDVRGTVVVELEGDVSDDDDFDGRFGALLVLPSRIVSVTPVADVPELAGVLARDEAVR